MKSAIRSDAPAPRYGAHGDVVPNSPTHLALRDDAKLRMLAARDAFCPPEVLAALICDPVEAVRRAAASHSELPRCTMARIVESGVDESLCECIARNPSAPAQVLRLLAVHPSDDVRTACARNPYASQAVLVHLARDRFAPARLAARAALERRTRPAR